MRDWRAGQFVEVNHGYVTLCLEWQGSCIRGGYGKVMVNGRLCSSRIENFLVRKS